MSHDLHTDKNGEVQAALEQAQRAMQHAGWFNHPTSTETRCAHDRAVNALRSMPSAGGGCDSSMCGWIEAHCNLKGCTNTPRSASAARDTERLNWLESLLWSNRIGNGIAIFPTTTLPEHGSVRHIALQDLGDEDGSNLGDELTDTQNSLRDAIDAAMSATTGQRGVDC